MKAVLITVNALLVAAVAYLLIKVSSLDGGSKKETTLEAVEGSKSDSKSGNSAPSGLTGRIAYVNIDSLNEKSEYIADLTKELKARKNVLEGSFQSLQTTYQTKVMELEESYKARIASEAQMQEEAKKIRQMETDMANKQVQMDNMVTEIAEKNAKFQDEVRDFLKTYSKDKFDYVLSFSTQIPSLLVGNEQLDITVDVIKQLNEQYRLKKSEKSKK
jgi:outer membrane protein